MINSHLPYEEQHALEAILRHHGLDPKGGAAQLTADLASFGNWIHQAEQARLRLGSSTPPPFLIAFLSGLGVYGKDVLTPPGGEVMTDPAVEAAQRAWDELGVLNPTAAAREALKPIRERHIPTAIYQVGRVCAHDGHRWPCADALDSYSTEELEAMRNA